MRLDTTDGFLLHLLHDHKPIYFLMLFNSIDYLVFFITFFVVYWFVLAKYLMLQNLFILIASYVFYGWWDWRFLSLIFLTSLSSYISARFIESRPQSKKAILWWTLILNFGILIYFKYAGFFIESFTSILHFFGVEVGYTFAQIILPVGISFYTFQALSYVIDVYRDDLKASNNFVECAAFISFFPQLVAGPIERAPHLLKQIQKPRYFDLQDAKLGLRFILWGLFKKMMVADNCAEEVDAIFGHYETMSMPMLWTGAVLFAVQIYCDFSAYSEIAVGSGKLLGVQFMKNFDYPYFAPDIKTFWKKWHISLTTWFKDYVFIPLGGSRSGAMATYKNVFIVFLLSGLWHGANYTFVIWGAYHAVLYIVYAWVIETAKWKMPNFISISFTFFFVLIGWVFFRSANASAAFEYLKNMFWLLPQKPSGLHAFDVAIPLKAMLGLSIMVVVEWVQRKRHFGLDIGHWSSMYIRWVFYILLILIVLIYGNFNEQTFIYFNF